MRAADVMTSPVVCVPPETSVKEAALTLLQHRISAAPVVEGDQLLGMVSELDVLWGEVVADPTAHVRPVHVSATGPTTVRDVMTPDVIAMTADTDVADLLTHMRSAAVRSIPIVEGNRVVGIVARRDLLRSLTRADDDVLRDLLTHLAAAAPDGDQWDARVEGGVVTLWPVSGSAPDPDVAVRSASTVPGVLHVRVADGPPAPS